MKKSKCDVVLYLGRQRSIQILGAVGVLYLLFVSLEVPFVLRTGFSAVSQEGVNGFRTDPPSRRYSKLESAEDLEKQKAPVRPLKVPLRVAPGYLVPLPWQLKEKENVKVKTKAKAEAKTKTKTNTEPQRRVFSEHDMMSAFKFDEKTFNSSSEDGFSELHKMTHLAFQLGVKLWEEIRSGKVQLDAEKSVENRTEPCPPSIFVSGSEFSDRGRVMEIPCGLALGSSIAIIGKPRAAHPEKDPKISMLKDGDQALMVSQFMVELQGLKTVDGEAPPKILHFNPRLKGDWSRRPVIELNTCYRMQWGSALRCDGVQSKEDEETVDGQLKCENWIRGKGDYTASMDSAGGWWLNRLMGTKKKMPFLWPYPFAENKHFVLIVSAGLEGYHLTVDGRHVVSFPYHTGFSLEDATGLFVNGDVDVHSLFASSLPTAHPSFAPQKHLEMSSRWQAPPISDGRVDLFVGILSAGHHFAERMAVRKSWMQHNLVKSSNVVARFFVALHARKEVDVELKKEAEYFGDIVIVPYMDNYNLVVLKTVAICEYGVRVSAKYIMKCDDDTFVRPDVILRQVKRIPEGKSLYLGNMNYYHKPMRQGKWAVTYDEWPEEEYPPYANGAAYVLSSDIGRFVVSEFQKHRLRLFKMEDVSMGMWVEQFSRIAQVEYLHSLKFCQFGCVQNYWTAHYQSPRQMICLWTKLQEWGRPHCCNMR